MAKPLTIILWLLRIALAGVFLYAGALKIADPAQFFQDILNYQIVGEPVAWLAALYLPWLEVIAAAALLIPKTTRASAIIIATLMLIFTAALLSAWLRGLDITCGCFGTTLETSNYPLLLTRDLALLAVALATLYSPCKLESRTS